MVGRQGPCRATCLSFPNCPDVHTALSQRRDWLTYLQRCPGHAKDSIYYPLRSLGGWVLVCLANPSFLSASGPNLDPNILRGLRAVAAEARLRRPVSEIDNAIAPKESQFPGRAFWRSTEATRVRGVDISLDAWPLRVPPSSQGRLRPRYHRLRVRGFNHSLRELRCTKRQGRDEEAAESGPVFDPRRRGSL